MKKRVLFYLLMCILFQTICFAQEVKNALLIANNEYGKDIGFLTQPVSEARNLKRALESIGFNVTLVENANRESMEDALLNFKEKCEKAGGIAFFHYGGHAVQIDGVNYLLPANTRLDNISQVRFKCVNIENLMDSMQGDSNIVVLDSCRNNPFKSGSRGGATTRGLVAVKKQPHNSIIIYSAHADETAQDGIFTPILTQYITEKNISLEDVLKKVRREVLKKTDNEQYPGEYNQLTGSIYLAGRSNNGNDANRVGSQALQGFLDVSVYTTCSIFVDNEYIDEVEAFSQKRFSLSSGVHNIKAKYKDGKSESTDVVIKSNVQEKWNSTYLSREQVNSCVALAIKYLKGTGGVAKDYQKAFEYAKIAADAGDSLGEYNVGFCFEEGLSVSKNATEALRWYKKAAEKGNGDAMWKVGTFYHYGKGNVNKDYKEAKRWYEKAISSNWNNDCVTQARNNLNEINALIAEEEKVIPEWAGGLWRLEANVGYNFSYFATKHNEIAFDAHGFTLGLTPARFRLFSGLDLKVRIDYKFAVKNFASEKLIYNDFSPVIFQIGYYQGWFAFHVGFAVFSFLFETVSVPEQVFSTTHAQWGFTFPIDLELEIYDRYIFYAEYTPGIRFFLLSIDKDYPSSFYINHALSIGFQIKIVDRYIY